MAVPSARATSTLEALASIVGSEYLLTDEHSCSLYAQDVYTKGLPALCVACPNDTQELSQVVKTAVDAGHAVIARGGGMSYTSGYVPKEQDSIMIDMSRMSRVLEINTEDMYVTVQCGCTWNELHLALKDTGFRTPYWGTLSGIRASVGGGMSQNSIFWGSTQYGTAVDSLIGLEVVLADGTVIKTGSQAQTNGSAFFRHYGPDFTGLFTCDNGALGFKATATLRLIPERPARDNASFDFADYPELIKAMSEIARADISAECFAFDPYLQHIRMVRESLVSDVKKLAGVMKESGSVLGALKDGAKVAMAGRGFMKNVAYSLHVMAEEKIPAAAQAAIDQARDICKKHGGKEISDSIPKILRANPFTPLNNVVGPKGERWVPVHTLVPHSKAESTYKKIVDIFANNQDLIDKHNIGVGFLLALVSTNGFVIEPVFFTPDAMTEIHEHTVEPAVYKGLQGFDASPDAAAATAKIRAELLEMFCEVGGIHMQIGKAYPYKQGLEPESWRLLEDIKQTVDPNRRINPGSLGLD
ncbi:MAG: FAD-binding oxidoreductase [Pseudomonadota bacterium]